MSCRVWIAAISITACGFGTAVAGDVEAVAPGAAGVLTKCRGWLVATSCNLGHAWLCSGPISSGLL
jgi:hypothetical protein